MRGTVYVLGDNIDTDQILTAEYLKINPASAEGVKSWQRLPCADCRKGRCRLSIRRRSVPVMTLLWPGKILAVALRASMR